MIECCRLDDAHGLPASARAAFARDGVLVIEDFASAAACAALRERALALVAEHAPQAPGTVFSTRDQRHAKDAYFEASANRIGAFFEEGAFDAAGRLQVPLERAVNQLGHAMHDFDPDFRAFSRGPRLQAVAEGVGLVEGWGRRRDTQSASWWLMAARHRARRALKACRVRRARAAR